MNRKQFFLLPCAGLLIAAILNVLLNSPSTLVHAQSASSATDAAAEFRELDELIKTIGQQQLKIAKNLVELETKMDALDESLRQARIYSSRIGRTSYLPR